MPERGEEWLKAVIDYHVNGSYGKVKNLKDFEGYIKALKERERREIKIINSLEIEKVIIEEANKDWKKTYKEIEDFLKR